MNLVLSILMLGLQLAGSEFTYTVQKGDSLTSLGARLGIDVRVIAETNAIPIPSRLHPGTILRIDNRHIIPESEDLRIVVNVPQRMLFLFEDGSLKRSFPVAAGRRGWRTPLGAFRILTTEVDPTWDVPPSIQAEMEREGKPVLTHVPPGPANPLGKYWLGLSLPGVGIHGTNAPTSIYSLQTHGCIRLHPDDIEQVYNVVAVGTTGKVIYQPVLIALIGNAVFLEVHRDIYRVAGDPMATVQAFTTGNTLPVLLDWERVKEVIQDKDGIARDVTSRP